MEKVFQYTSYCTGFVQAPEHPIMEGFPEVWMAPVDEVYIVRMEWGTITTCTGVWQRDREISHGAWPHETDNNRVFATTLGHHNEIYEQEGFLNLITKGLLWAVKKL